MDDSYAERNAARRAADTNALLTGGAVSAASASATGAGRKRRGSDAGTRGQGDDQAPARGLKRTASGSELPDASVGADVLAAIRTGHGGGAAAASASPAPAPGPAGAPRTGAAGATDGFAGLSNQGATCYMNSLLQAWFMTPEFRDMLFRWRYDPKKDGTHTMCVPLQLQKLFAQLQTTSQRSVATRALTTSFGWSRGEAFQQHDVQELAHVLLDALDRTVKHSTEADGAGATEAGAAGDGAGGEAGGAAAEAGASPDGADSAAEDGAAEAGAAEDGAAEDGAAEDGAAEDGAAEDGAAEDGAAEEGAGETRLPSSLFTGEQDDYVQCRECGTYRSQKAVFHELALELKPFGSDRAYTSIGEAMAAFSRPETLDESNKVSCDKCGRKTLSVKGLRVTKWPQLLTLQLKRFTIDMLSPTLARVKLQDRMAFPFSLDAEGIMAKVAAGEEAEAVRMGDAEEDEEDEEDEEGSHGAAATGADAPAPAGPEEEDEEEDDGKASDPADEYEDGKAADARKDPAEKAMEQALANFNAGGGAASASASTALIPYSPLPSGPGAAVRNPPPPPPRNRMVTPPPPEGQYELYGVLVHSGGAAGGHYYAYVKDLEGCRWWNFNDSYVSSIDEATVRRAFGGGTASYGASAYMLLYRRVGKGEGPLPAADGAPASARVPPRRLFPSTEALPEALREHIHLLEAQQAKEEAERAAAARVATLTVRLSEDDDAEVKVRADREDGTIGEVLRRALVAHGVALPDAEAAEADGYLYIGGGEEGGADPTTCWGRWRGVDLRLWRLRRWDQFTAMGKAPFPNLAATLSAAAVYSNSQLVLERRASADEPWRPYSISDVRFHLLPVHPDTGEVGDRQSFTMSRTTSLGGLRAEASRRTGIPPRSLRLVLCTKPSYKPVTAAELVGDRWPVNRVGLTSGGTVYVEDLRSRPVRAAIEKAGGAVPATIDEGGESATDGDGKAAGDEGGSDAAAGDPCETTPTAGGEGTTADPAEPAASGGSSSASAADDAAPGAAAGAGPSVPALSTAHGKIMPVRPRQGGASDRPKNALDGKPVRRTAPPAPRRNAYGQAVAGGVGGDDGVPETPASGIIPDGEGQLPILVAASPGAQHFLAEASRISVRFNRISASKYPEYSESVRVSERGSVGTLRGLIAERLGLAPGALVLRKFSATGLVLASRHDSKSLADHFLREGSVVHVAEGLEELADAKAVPVVAWRAGARLGTSWLAAPAMMTPEEGLARAKEMDAGGGAATRDPVVDGWMPPAPSPEEAEAARAEAARIVARNAAIQRQEVRATRAKAAKAAGAAGADEAKAGADDGEAAGAAAGGAANAGDAGAAGEAASGAGEAGSGGAGAADAVGGADGAPGGAAAGGQEPGADAAGTADPGDGAAAEAAAAEADAALVADEWGPLGEPRVFPSEAEAGEPVSVAIGAVDTSLSMRVGAFLDLAGERMRATGALSPALLAAVERMRDAQAAAKDGEAAAKGGEAAAKDGETAAKDGETAAKDGETAAKDGETSGAAASGRPGDEPAGQPRLPPRWTDGAGAEGRLEVSPGWAREHLRVFSGAKVVGEETGAKMGVDPEAEMRSVASYLSEYTTVMVAERRPREFVAPTPEELQPCVLLWVRFFDATRHTLRPARQVAVRKGAPPVELGLRLARVMGVPVGSLRYSPSGTYSGLHNIDFPLWKAFTDTYPRVHPWADASRLVIKVEHDAWPERRLPRALVDRFDPHRAPAASASRTYAAAPYTVRRRQERGIKISTHADRQAADAAAGGAAGAAGEEATEEDVYGFGGGPARPPVRAPAAAGAGGVATASAVEQDKEREAATRARLREEQAAKDAETGEEDAGDAFVLEDEDGEVDVFGMMGAGAM